MSMRVWRASWLAGWSVSTLVSVSMVASAQDAGDAARGKRLFLQCQACHSLQAGNGGTVGPSLAGVVGRAAATLPGYAYSPALTASKLTWTDAMLDAWLTRPNALVPNTKMIFAGMPNVADRAAIIAYLKTSTAASAGASAP